MPPQTTDLPVTGNGKATENGNGTLTNDGGGGQFNKHVTEKLNNLKTANKQEEEKWMDTPATANVVVPPDGGWGWVVMMASFSCNVIVDGIVFSAGMFLKPIGEEFNASTPQTALVSSLLSGFYLLAGPFVSAAANRWGFRPVTIVGAFIACIGFVLSRFATSVFYLYLTYGFIGGIGFCLIYMPSVITVGYYFERWRALATGISLCGSGVGTFIMAPVSTMLINALGWRDALLVQAGMILLCAFFGLAFRPIKPIQVTVSNEPEKERILRPEVKAMPDSRLAYSVPNSVHNTWMGAISNTQYPTAAEIFRGGSNHNLDRRPSTDKGAMPQGRKLEHIGAKIKKSSGPPTPEETPAQMPLLQHHELKTVGEAEEEENENGTTAQGTDDNIQPVQMTRRRHTVSEREPIKRSVSRPNEGTRPMYRDDIFFSGSLQRVPQYTSQSSIAYHMSVTRLPTQHDVQEETESSCKICPEAVRRTLATMLDVSLFKSPTFMLLAFSGFFTMMGFFVPFLYISRRAQEAGMETGAADMIVSAIGITNTVARIVCGFLSSFESVSALHLNNVAITIGGIATIFSGAILEPWYQYTYAFIFGIAIACFSGLRSILVVDLMGLEKLTNAFGILMLFQGLAAGMGAPIAGFFKDYTGGYDASFWLSGALITISAILCYPLSYVKRMEEKKLAELKNGKSLA